MRTLTETGNVEEEAMVETHGVIDINAKGCATRKLSQGL